MSATDLSFSEFVELILARVYEADRQQSGTFANVTKLGSELRQEIPEAWPDNAVDVLEERGFVEDMSVMQAATAILTGKGRLFVESGGETGIIPEYRDRPTNFVVVRGTGHQVAVGVEGNVTQTSVQVAVPDEALESPRSDQGRSCF